MVCRHIGRANIPKKGDILTRESDRRKFKVIAAENVKMIGGRVDKEFTLTTVTKPKGLTFKTDLGRLEMNYLLGRCSLKAIIKLKKGFYKPGEKG